MNSWYVYKVQADHYATERRREAEAHRQARQRTQAGRTAAAPSRARWAGFATRLRSVLALGRRPGPRVLRVRPGAQPVPCGHGTPAP